MYCSIINNSRQYISEDESLMLFLHFDFMFVINYKNIIKIQRWFLSDFKTFVFLYNFNSLKNLKDKILNENENLCESRSDWFKSTS